MKEETLPLLPDRRHLLTRVLPAGALACLACRGAFAATEPVKSGSGARVRWARALPIRSGSGKGGRPASSAYQVHPNE